MKKETCISALGSASGITSILGSWQICHNLCLGVISLLGIVGITGIGMPFMFLTTLAFPLWTFGVVLLGILVAISYKKKCISKNLLLFNGGLLVAGVPFRSLQHFSPLFWIVGGVIAGIGVALLFKEKWHRGAR